ncbi:MAG: TetR/AcrR family transcriptional regulator [Deltaproteobacteria bacterium]|nr:TetR/AcrR family transcriptional regulator [Deltaproteobacteria bacterium]
MNKQKREQQILDNALRTFVGKGYSDVSVSDLVKDARVSRGTFYLYFKSKEEIFNRLLNNFTCEILEHIALFDGYRISAGNISFSGVCRGLAQTLTKYRLLARFIALNSSELSKMHRAKINECVRQCYQILEHNINHGIEIGIFKPVNAVVVSHALIGAIKEFLSAWSFNSEVHDLDSNIYQLLSFVRDSLCVENTDSTHHETLNKHGFMDERLIIRSREAVNGRQ